MTLHVVQVPSPPAGMDFSAVVPGIYTYDVTGITATLVTGSTATVARDSSGNGYDGTYVFTPSSSALFAQGRPGIVPGDTAVDFTTDGTHIYGSEMASPFEAIDLGGDVTCEGFFADIGSHALEQHLFVALAADTFEMDFGITSAGEIFMFRGGSLETYMTTAVYPFDGNGHLIQWVLPFAGTFAVLLDGVSQPIAATVAPGSRFRVGATTWQVGVSTVGTGASGRMDEFAVYASALSGGQCAAHNAARGSFAGYTAAVLADTPDFYYHLDDGGSTGREPSLVVTNGTTDVIAIPPGFPAVSTPGPFTYAWQPDLNADTQSTDGTLTTVAIPRLILPSGYVVGSRTPDLQAGDQWSNVALWWDDSYQEAIDPLNGYLFGDGVRLRYQQIGT